MSDKKPYSHFPRPDVPGWKKVFVVMEGYENGCCGVFTTLEKAAAYIDRKNRSDDDWGWYGPWNIQEKFLDEY